MKDHLKNSFPWFTNQRGWLAVALTLTVGVTGLLIITSRTGTLIDRLYRARDIAQSDQAAAASRSLIERGILESRLNGLGYENPEGEDMAIADINNDGVPDVWGEYEVWARAKKVGWRAEFLAGDANYASCDDVSSPCVVPIPGTGNAGSECDFTDTAQDWAQPTTSSATGLNNDCNWNKLRYGEVVSIPLYYEDASCTGGICNPAELGLTTFTLRVRTPNGETLNTDVDGNGEEDIVVNWEITGDCDTDDLLPEEAEESCWMIGKAINPLYGYIDSFINASDVNTAIENGVVDEGSVGEMWDGRTYSTTLEFLTTNESDPFGYTLNFEILNPLLTLSVVSPLENAATLGSVPYLEYQLQVDKPISDAKISLSTVGYAEGKRGIYPSYQRAFFLNDLQSLIQFVIQN